MDGAHLGESMNPLFSGTGPAALPLRGLHLDPCRHFIEVPTVLRILEQMAALKLNTLHLHLSDDQAIPIEVACAPHIQSSPRYSIADQEVIAARAEALGIDIIIELDIPGHAVAFLSFVDPAIQREERLGLITEPRIDLDRDLPVILEMFEELTVRFGARYIHFGGDEAAGYPRLVELVERVCGWAKDHNLEVIAWDDILSELSPDQVPPELIIHRWHRRVDPAFDGQRFIQSWGYYLDRVENPFTLYERDPVRGENQLGCIACMWTELVTDRTVERTLFPSLYMIAHRWWHVPERHPHPPVLLRELCETLGYPDTEGIDGWRTRRWVGFYRDDPRSTSSVTVRTALDRDQDLVPVFSRALVIATDILYRFFNLGFEPTSAEVEPIIRLGLDRFGEDLSFIFARGPGLRARLEALVSRVPPDARWFNDGLKVAIRSALRGPLQPRPNISFDPPSGHAVSVMSYNVLLPNGVDGWWIHKCYPPKVPEADRQWPARQRLLAEQILTANPDVICLQETSPTSFEDDFSFLIEAGYHGVQHRRGRLRPATFYRSDRLTLDQAFHHDRGLVTALSYGDRAPLYVINVHLMAGPQPERRLRQVHEALDRVRKLVAARGGAPDDAAVLVCGDFNAHGGATSVSTLLTEGQAGKRSHPFGVFLDVYGLAYSPDDPPPTFVVPNYGWMHDESGPSSRLIQALEQLYASFGSEPWGKATIDQWLTQINGSPDRGTEHAAVQAIVEGTGSGLTRDQFVGIYVQALKDGKPWAIAYDLHQAGIELPPSQRPPYEARLDQMWFSPGLQPITVVPPWTSAQRRAIRRQGQTLPNQMHPSDHLPLIAYFDRSSSR